MNDCAPKKLKCLLVQRRSDVVRDEQTHQRTGFVCRKGKTLYVDRHNKEMRKNKVLVSFVDSEMLKRFVSLTG